jgi:hypothetical protein
MEKYDLINNAFVLPFGIEEDEIREHFLDWLITDEDAYLDVAYRAQITSCKQQYYPFRFFDIGYQSSWQATSIWEEQQQQPRTVSKTVFVDKYGAEYSMGGQGRTPLSKNETVYDTVTVEVRRERTSGHIQGTDSRRILFNSPQMLSGLGDWIVSMEFNDNDLLTAVPPSKSEVEIMPLVGSDEEALNSAISKTKGKAELECKSQVPGTRHIEFKMYDFRYDFDLTVFYLPVYEICYTVGNENFKVYFCGYNKDLAFFKETCKDPNLREINSNAKEQISYCAKELWRMRLSAFLYPINIFGLIGATLFSWWTTGGFIALGIWALFYVLRFLLRMSPNINKLRETPVLKHIVAKSYFAQAKDLKIKRDTLQTNRVNYVRELHQQRQRVLHVVKNNDITDEQKKSAVENLRTKEFAIYNDSPLCCPKCRNNNIELFEKPRTALEVIIDLIPLYTIIFKRRIWRCTDCKHEFSTGETAIPLQYKV